MRDDFFESLMQTVSDTAEVVGKKTEDLVASQKIKTKICTAERSLEKKYKELGEKSYQRFMEGDEVDQEIADICEAITAGRAVVSTLKDELAGKRGQCICPACGNSNPISAVFCMRCGKELVKEEKQEEPVAEEPVEEPEEHEIFETVEEPEVVPEETAEETPAQEPATEESPAADTVAEQEADQ